jgi:hypothetical protein
VTRLRERWDRFWFEPAPPAALGFCRLVFFAGLFWLQWPFRTHTWALTPASYRRPIWIYKALDLPFLNQQVLITMEICWAVAIVLAAIGLFTRAATAVCVVLGFYLLSLGNNFGKIGHGDQALAITMLILALSRCGDAWSMDAWRATRGDGGDALRRRPPSGEYRWPIRMVWLLMSLVFCAAGASKLVRSGHAWFTSDHLAMTLIQAHHYHLKPPTPIGLYLARFPLLCNVMAAGVVMLELAFPLALVWRRVRAPIVLATLMMQIGIGLLMAVWFRQFLFLYIFWVPWDRVGRALAAGAARFRHASPADGRVAAHGPG